MTPRKWVQLTQPFKDRTIFRYFACLLTSLILSLLVAWWWLGTSKNATYMLSKNRSVCWTTNYSSYPTDWVHYTFWFTLAQLRLTLALSQLGVNYIFTLSGHIGLLRWLGQCSLIYHGKHKFPPWGRSTCSASVVSFNSDLSFIYITTVTYMISSFIRMSCDINIFIYFFYIFDNSIKSILTFPILLAGCNVSTLHSRYIAAISQSNPSRQTIPWLQGRGNVWDVFGSWSMFSICCSRTE